MKASILFSSIPFNVTTYLLKDEWILTLNLDW